VRACVWRVSRKKDAARHAVTPGAEDERVEGRGYGAEGAKGARGRRMVGALSTIYRVHIYSHATHPRHRHRHRFCWERATSNGLGGISVGSSAVCAHPDGTAEQSSVCTVSSVPSQASVIGGMVEG